MVVFEQHMTRLVFFGTTTLVEIGQNKDGSCDFSDVTCTVVVILERATLVMFEYNILMAHRRSP